MAEKQQNLDTVTRVTVRSAAPRYAGDIVMPAVIVIGEHMKEGLTDEQYAANGDTFQEDAKALFDALLAALPGGTFCQLTALMLQEKASHFIVSHASVESKQTAPKPNADVAMYQALNLGDSLGNSGPLLLNHAADLIKTYAPVTAEELRRKASAEHRAILAATGDTDLVEELATALERITPARCPIVTHHRPDCDICHVLNLISKVRGKGKNTNG